MASGDLQCSVEDRGDTKRMEESYHYPSLQERQQKSLQELQRDQSADASSPLLPSNLFSAAWLEVGGCLTGAAMSDICKVCRIGCKRRWLGRTCTIHTIFRRTNLLIPAQADSR